MATYQVRTDANGQKILSGPLSGLSSSIATSELPGAVQPDGLTTKVDSVGILSALGGNLLMNDEIWITESGTFTAPVTGWYEVTCISGGDGASLVTISGSIVDACPGNGSAGVTKLVYLSQSDEIPVTVGAGGVGVRVAMGGSTPANANGGVTSFGDLVVCEKIKRNLLSGSTILPRENNTVIYAPGGGRGAGTGSSDRGCDGAYFGAGGSAARATTGDFVGNGYQGGIFIRFHNPAKAAGPSE